MHDLYKISRIIESSRGILVVRASQAFAQSEPKQDRRYDQHIKVRYPGDDQRQSNASGQKRKAEQVNQKRLHEFPFSELISTI